MVKTQSPSLQARAILELRKRGVSSNGNSLLWQPNPDALDGTPNPQRLAYESEADIIGYGGSGGSGKTDLLLGLAATKHRHSVIFRRVFPSSRGIIERSREIFNREGMEHSRDSFNESLHRWNLADGRVVEIESCQYEKDKIKQRGIPRDLHCFDEVTEFTRSQVEFITAWNRSTDPDIHCQVVMTFNPPTDEVGNWVVDYFLPWIAYLFPKEFQHPNPAKPGELRWYASVDGKEIEVENGQPFEHNGVTIKPRSRTFIPGKLRDNPHLAGTNYEAVLQSLPEPLRSQVLLGDFGAARTADPWQVIPTDWVRRAQTRWLERDAPETPLTAVGIDAARGGGDNMTVSKRRDNWFDDVDVTPGINVEDGPALAAIVWQQLNGEEPTDYINIDVVGIGSSGYDSLKMMYDNVVPVNAGAGSDYRDRSGSLKMRNVRAEYYWRLREALDPVHGDSLALPLGNEIVADLCAARYKMTTAGLQIEEKDEIKKRIGRSPDVGEAILLSNYRSDGGGVIIGSVQVRRL
jgi:hypothetical protein